MQAQLPSGEVTYHTVEMVKAMKRLPMRNWLIEKLDHADYPGLKWIDRRQGLMRVAWKHASRQTYSLEKDACVFRAWAKYTGKYTGTPDPKRWKTNFRCALNSLPGIKELKDSRKQGPSAQKVYIMDITNNGDNKDSRIIKTNKTNRSKATTGDECPSDSEIVELVDEMSASSPTCDVTSTDDVTSTNDAISAGMTSRNEVKLFGADELMQITDLLQKGIVNTNSEEIFTPWLVPAAQTEVEIACY